jgi:hypothetical protein
MQDEINSVIKMLPYQNMFKLTCERMFLKVSGKLQFISSWEYWENWKYELCDIKIKLLKSRTNPMKLWSDIFMMWIF